MKTRMLIRYTASLGLAAIMGITAGCASNRGDRSTGEYVDDVMVANRVEDALGDDALHKFPAVKVTSYRGSVQLSGFVQNDEQRARAAEVASKVQGVRDVVNSIQVRPMAPTGRTNDTQLKIETDVNTDKDSRSTEPRTRRDNL